MTTDRYAALRAALEAGPLPGRRYRGRGPHSYCVYDKECWHAPDGSRHGETPNLVIEISPEDAGADAALIAACDPETIAALLKERDAAAEMNDEVCDLREVLLRHGFVPCDIPACNCGSWHPRFGLRERMDEITADLDASGHPLSNENGNSPRNALRGLIAERDALREAVEGLLNALPSATTHPAISAARAALAAQERT